MELNYSFNELGMDQKALSDLLDSLLTIYL